MSACPSEDLLAALVDKRIEDEKAVPLREHVDSCSRCLKTMDTLKRARTATTITQKVNEVEVHTVAEDWAPPPSFDDFRILRPLGRGGMGRVYLGQDVVLDRPVALKFIAADSPDPRALDRFYLEARAIARLQHPNVVSVYRIGTARGRPYLAYELVPGDGLDSIAIPVGWQTALHVGLGIARGLAAAHRAGVLHRDIKPANVVLSIDGAVKLIDFGLAKLVGDDIAVREALPRYAKGAANQDRPALLDESASAKDLENTMPASHLTEGITLLGTPLYLAPELWRGDPATPRSDVYALGLLLYQLCYGRLQHADLSLRELAFLSPTLELPPLRSQCPSVPEILADTIDRCVRNKPEERFASAEEVRLAFEAADAFCRAFRTTDAGGLELDVARVSDSFARIAPRAEELVSRFYRRLFESAPSLRPLFPSDLTQQRMKLAASLQLTLSNLRRPERLVSLLEDLGRRHAPYRVEPSHFDAFGRALLDALAEQEGSAWTPDTERAWARAFAHIAGVMRRGLEEARAPFTFTGRVMNTLGDVPHTQYASRAGGALAYQVLGAGPVDLVLVAGGVTHLEIAWHHSAMAQFFRALALTSRLILIDQRGTGMSERELENSLELRVEDLREVLKKVGSSHPVLFGVGAGGALCALYTAAYAEHTRGLILYGSAATGAGDAALAPMEREIEARWGESIFLEQLAPSLASDASFRSFWAAYLRLAATPSVAMDLLRRDASVDIRWVLPSICVPCLVLHRRGDKTVASALSRDLADRIPGARYVELSGEDHLPYAGDIEPLVSEIRGFLEDVAG